MRSVSVVIVNWNAVELLPACMESLDRQSAVELRDVIVVDNKSSDGSIEWLEQHRADFGFELVVVANVTNAGFGVANNQGARLATGEVLVILNPDTELVGKDCLAALANALDDANIGLVGPHMLNPDGTTQRSCAAFPSITNSFLLATRAHLLLPASTLRRLVPGESSQDQTTLVDWVLGACLVFRTKDFQAIGGFSEATFMYGEDLEIAFDIRRRGLRTLFLREAEVMHHDDYSANKRWATPERTARVARAELSFLKRKYPPYRQLAIRAINLVGLSARWAVHSLRGDERAEMFGAMAWVYLRGN